MNWEDAQTAFAASLPGYEDRPHQTALAQTIEKAFANGESLAAQAGTGTGKSFAALVPAINHAKITGLPVVVGTATISLLHQYTKDFAFLEEHLGTDFKWALLKGRRNYACKAKIAELEPNTVANQDKLLAELAVDGHDGDLQNLTFAVEPRDAVQITSSADECPGKSNCIFGEVCHAEMAKAKAREADVILATHAMVATDLVIRAAQMAVDPEKEPMSVLPSFGSIVLDEGHEFAEYMSGALSNEFSERGMHFLATEVANLVGRVDQITAVQGATKSVFDGLTRILAKERKTSIRMTDGMIYRLETDLSALHQAILAMRDVVKLHDVTGNDKAKIRRARLMKRTGNAADRLLDLIVSEGDDLVRWIERDERKNDVRLKYAPLSVAGFLRENLWADHDGVVLSATMGIGSDFSFVTDGLGMGNPAKFDAGSPFNYPKQARLYIPEGFDPSPAKAAQWRVQAQETMRRLVLKANGGALLLFTSTKNMKDAYEALAPTFRRAGLTTLMQGMEGMNNKQIAETFKSDVTSVLFGLKSFATGFDVQGHSLHLVVVDKAPFTSPDDIMFAARGEVLNKKYNNDWAFFNRLAVPIMALALFQFFGRLIRTGSDEGLIAILDSRLITKGYGRNIVKALPPAGRVGSLEAAEAYLEDLNARKG